MGLNDTPRANRIHIGLFGKRNGGKSSLINALTGQDVAIVSPYAGTTADPVFKAMELYPIGPVVFIDTAGFDDEGELGKLRVAKTKAAMKKADIAIMVMTETELEEETCWCEELKKRRIPIIGVINKADIIENAEEIREIAEKKLGIKAVIVSATSKAGLEDLRKALTESVPEDYESRDITEGLIKEDEVALLVMPQDIQAPKGRLILPQVQTIRELLDKGCTVISTTTDKLDNALLSLKAPPKLIITDSQCFKLVHGKKPPESLLTSFSVLFAAYKGDLDAFVRGAEALDSLTEQGKVLIAEACTHAPLEEDIGRIKIPNWLKKQIGDGLSVEVVSGVDFPKDLSGYDLIIHCGACMFNRKYMMSRVEEAKAQGVPITNYGVVLAKLMGILNEVTLQQMLE